jgi:hypothetical protein
MEADWEVEIGGGAPVIEVLWPGFVDLRAAPERIVEIAEAATFPPLAGLLLALNAPESPVWTSKCDRWEPEPGALGIYIDMLPREGELFAEWGQAEAFCREYVSRLGSIAFPECGGEPGSVWGEDSSAGMGPAYTIDLVIRAAVADRSEGFGITAYLGARAVTPAEKAAGRMTAAEVLAGAMAGFQNALPPAGPPATAGSKLQ